MYVLPKPQHMELGTEAFALSWKSRVRTSPDCGAYARLCIKQLKEELEKSAGVTGVEEQRNERGEAEIYLEMCPDMKSQHYSLVINEKGVLISGGDEKGILYGVQTLRQIIRQEGMLLPFVKIEDFPMVENRGFYCDATRGRIPTMEYMKKMADRLCFYKMNQLQLYVEHSFLMDGLSEMWRDDTPLCPEDIMELDAYCLERGIELVPSLSSFGHLYKLLRTKQYAQFGEYPEKAKEPFSFVGRQDHHTLNVSLEEPFRIVKNMIDQYLPLFTSRKFNIGADETFDLGMGAGKEMAEKVGKDRMYLDFVKKLCLYLTEQGRTPMFWGDVICGFPELVKELPQGTICLNWGYAWNQSEDSAKALYDAGAIQYMCPGTGGWNQFINLMESAYSNISRMCFYGKKYNAIGVLNTDWGDFGHVNHPDSSVPGLIYGAALSWNWEDVSIEEMNRRISRIEYGDRSGKFMEIITALSRQSSYGWDTADFFYEIQTGSLDWSKDRADAHMEERRELAGQADEKNAQIDKYLFLLKECVSHMDSADRQKAAPFALMAEGMRIFNTIGAVKEKENGDFYWLAEKLECWFMEYKKLWRSVSRESELYRISEMIFWYADYLREMKKGNR